jgi:DNA-binding beta-propeller fold protein YncE
LLRLFVCLSLLAFTAHSAFGQAQNYLRNNIFVNWESPHVHPLDVTQDGTKLLAVNTANNSLEIYNIANASQAPVFVRSVPVGLDPVTVRARTNTQAWVVNVISDSVSVVDLTNGIVTRTLQADDEPADVVFAGSSQSLAFVSCAQAKTLLVFNAANPTTPQQRIAINGEQPRALATSADGRYVYLAIFESGNATTILPGGVNNGYEHSDVDDPSGPYGGVNPPPNTGNTFTPAQNPANPAPFPVSLIVRKYITGPIVKWLDDNNHDWSAFITGSKARTGVAGDRVAGWDLPDRDVAVIDTGNNYAVTYQSSLMNMVMSIGVNPSTGNVSVVGTDATNQIRFEPVLQGKFVHVEGASFTPGGTNTIFDLNPHITYQVANVPVAQRQLSIGDPRGIAWNAAGTVEYVTGMGSNNVIEVSNTGARLGLINVGQGPTGIVLNEANGRAFVLNKFDATISTINISSGTQEYVTALQFDPTPSTIKLGRPFLYNTQLTSGLGQISCGSCHVDGRTDRLSWDLGDPAGTVVTNSEGVSFPPMKGPMLTMTLVDMIQAPFLHWRGDRQLDDFEGAFQTLQGADAPETDANMDLLKAFLATITLPPDPYRNLDNSYSTQVQMPGPNNTVYTTGNAVLGAQEFEVGCRSSCHLGETNRGAAFITTNLPFGYGVRNPPNWKNFYKRIGLWYGDPTASNSGFGTQQDGTFDSSQNGSRDPNMYAFMMSMNGGYPYEPTGLNANNWSNYAHAAVGKQVTLSPANPVDTTGLLAQLQTLAGQGAIGLVAKGAPVGLPVRGWMYLGNNLWQSDSLAEVDSTATLMNNVANNTTLTFTAVPTESAVRIGIDMDSDGILDSDDPSPAIPNATVTNMALNGVATASPAYDNNHLAAAAIDGSTMGYADQDQMYISQDGLGTNAWWQVDLGTSTQISLIQLFNRWDCCAFRLTNVSVFVSQTPFTSTSITATRSQPGVQEFYIAGAAGLVAQLPMQTQGRYVRVELNDTVNALQLAEVRVFGYAIGSWTNPGNQTSAPGASVNLPLTFTNTTGNNYSFSAANLPAGLSIGSNGVISGTITAPVGTTYVTTVTAAGPGNPTISFNWTVASTTAPFKLSLSASTLTLAPNNGGYLTVSVAPSAGFSGTVNLTASGIPGTISSGFTSASATTFTYFVVWVPPGTAGGTYPVTINGVSGSSSAQVNFTLVVPQSQTISFPAIAGQNVGATYTLAATASSSLPVIYTASTPAVCSLTGNVLTMVAAGTCSVQASQAGNRTYGAATPVNQSFAVTTPQFTLSMTPQLTLLANTGTTTPITQTSGPGFNGSLNYSVSGLPPGVSYATVQTSPRGTTLVIYEPQNTVSGTYVVTVTGTSGAASASTSFVLAIP